MLKQNFALAASAENQSWAVSKCRVGAEIGDVQVALNVKA